MALRSSVTFCGALVLMLISSPWLTLYVLIAVPFVLLPIKLLGKKVRQYSRLSQDKVADIGAYIDETLHEIQTVQAYGHENADKLAFNQKIEAVMTNAKQRIHYRSLLIGTIMVISIVAVIIVAWIGAMDVISGSMTAGELTAFMFYAVLAGGSVATISEVIGEIQKAAGASERLIELLQVRPPIDPTTRLREQSTKTLTKTDVGDAGKNTVIDFENVEFAYPSAPNRKVLKGLTLQISRSERIALIGPSGAGKSTLYQLLLRFYDPSAGTIRINDQDITEKSLQTLRQLFAIVPQESVIFATSVMANIRYGRPNASDKEVMAAAKTAQADDFIRAMTQGYNADLGERGVKLSGGQKQRISIARAILADRPILLLDEATSALDAVSEQQVKIGLENMMKGKTTLIIAHRLSTVVNADRIIVLEEGEIIATGTHKQLLESNPLYQQHAALQLVNS